MRYLTKSMGFAFLALFSLVANAQTSPDVRLLIDKSGSMMINDPEKLRIPAVQLLANLLPSDSKAGIWTFGTGVSNLANFAKANGAWKKTAVANASKITSLDQFTDIEAALKTASFDLGKIAKSADKNIILLSDGMVDTSKSKDKATKNKQNQVAKDRLLRVTLPKLVNAGYKIHTIALSNDADKDLLSTISQKSGGLFGVANNADELLDLFVKALQRSVPQEEVPIKKDSSFLIDNSIIEFTVLAFHGKKSSPVTLQAPDGKTYKFGEEPSNTNWYSTKNYDLITVKKPVAGDWKLLSEKDTSNRVTVVSNLKMRTDEIPANLQRGKGLNLKVWFEQDGKTLKRQEFLNILTVKAELQDPQGGVIQSKDLTKTANGFEFKGDLFNINELGDLTLAVHANGKTFSRTLRKPLRVEDLVTAYLQQGDGYATLILRSEHKNIEANQLQISVSVGNKKFTPEYRGEGEWLLDLSQEVTDKEQAVKVSIAGRLIDQTLYLVLGNMVLETKEAEEAEEKPQPKPIEVAEEQVQETQQEVEEAQKATTENQATAQAQEEGILPNLDLSDQVPTDKSTDEQKQLDTDALTNSQDEANNANEQEKLQPNFEQAQQEPVQEATQEATQAIEEQQNTQVQQEQQTPAPEINPVAESTTSDAQTADIDERTQVEKDRLLWIYILVGLGNILLFLAAYLVYRKMIKGKKDEILND